MRALQDRRLNPKLQKNKSNMASPENQEGQQKQKQKRKKLTCPICRATFPDQDFYDSHQLIHAKRLVDMLDEEFPGYIDSMSKINENQKEVKNIEREIEFIEEQQRRETSFREEQQ